MHKVRRELEGPAVDADELREENREVGGHELVQEQVSRDPAAALGAGSHSGHRTGSAGSVAIREPVSNRRRSTASGTSLPRSRPPASRRRGLPLVTERVLVLIDDGPAPLAAGLPNVRRAVFNVVDAGHEAGGPDGVSELWFDSRAAFDAAYATEIGKTVAADSMAHVGGRVRLFATEHAIAGDAPRGGRKPRFDHAAAP